jgi:hypothetical protein
VRKSILNTPQVYNYGHPFISHIDFISQKVYEFLRVDPNESNAMIHSLDVNILSGVVQLCDLDQRSWPQNLNKLFVTLDNRASGRGRLQPAAASKDSEGEGRGEKKADWRDGCGGRTSSRITMVGCITLDLSGTKTVAEFPRISIINFIHK